MGAAFHLLLWKLPSAPGAGAVSPSGLCSPALLSPGAAPLPRFLLRIVGDRERGAAGGDIANVASGMVLLPTRPPSLHPGPAHLVFLSPSCWHRVNIPGWVSETCAPPHYPAPWGDGPAPARHKSQTFSSTPLHPKTRPGSRLCRQLTPLLAFPEAPTPPPPRRRGERGVRHREVDPQPPPRPGQPPPPPALPALTTLTWKPAQLPPTSLLRIANRTAGVGPPAGHSSASAALAESRGPNVRRGRTGGWLFFGG